LSYDGVDWLLLEYYSYDLIVVVILRLRPFIFLTLKENILFRRLQQSSKDSSLELNVPKAFTRLENLVKGDMLKCQIMNLKNNKNVLVLEKMEVTT
jgi:hypothetical protein